MIASVRPMKARAMKPRAEVGSSSIVSARAVWFGLVGCDASIECVCDEVMQRKSVGGSSCSCAGVDPEVTGLGSRRPFGGPECVELAGSVMKRLGLVRAQVLQNLAVA